VVTPARPKDGLRTGMDHREFRAKRGGSQGLLADRCSSATRGCDTRDTADRFTGLRLALAVE
jgi:hypothetical protein